MMRRWSATAILVLAPLLAYAQQLEIIPLQHRTADQVLPVLRPLLEPGGTLTGTQNQLIVRTSPKNLAELKKVLASIDTQPRRLMIYVRQDSGGAAERRGAEVTGTLGGGRVVIGNERGGTGSGRGVSAQVYDSRSAGEDRLVQQVQALEGSPALIQVGQVVPVTTSTVIPRNPALALPEVVQTTTTFQTISTGFQVTPRLSGERVYLDVSPQRETPGVYGPGSANTQRVSSSVSGRLGEWIELGGVTQDESLQGSALLARTNTLRQDNRRVWVRVEEIK